MNEPGDTPARFGVFRLGAMLLALPSEALREVVPAAGIAPLPCETACVVGVLDLRGVALPVIDLTRYLDVEARTTPSIVVVLAHGGRLLGLLIDAIENVVELSVERWSSISTLNGEPSLVAGGFTHPSVSGIVNVLDPEVVTTIPGVPTVIDPAPRTSSDAPLATDAEADGDLGDGSLHLLLLRTGTVPFAIRSVAVHTTLLDVSLRPSAITGGYCLGTIDVGGAQVPAIDLAQLCQLPPGETSAARQAFVVKFPAGLIAFMVEEIIDVVRSGPGCTILPLPRQALAQPGLFDGAVPLGALPEHVLRPTVQAKGYYLLLCSDALLALEHLASVALMNVSSLGEPAALARVGEATDKRAGRANEPTQVITFDIGFEVATPIDQVAEIVPFDAAHMVVTEGAAAAGMIVSRGRAIPIFSLAALMSQPEPDPSPSASVLVVEADEGCVGFTIPRLVAIDPVPWVRRPHKMDGRLDHPRAADATWKGWEPVPVGAPGSERLLTVLDLRRLAATL